MKSGHWIYILCFGLMLAGCAPRPLLKDQNLSAKDVLQLVELRNASVHSVYGRGTIKVESPEISTSGSFIVSMKKPDSLLLDLRGPFGIHVGTLSLTTQSFQYYNSLENTILEGVPDSTTLLSILHVGMRVERILDVFAGAYPTVQDSLLRFSATGDEYLMAFAFGGNIVEYRVDASTFIVTDYLVKDRNDKVLFKAESSQITSGSEIATPSVLNISFPDDARKISLFYRSITLNEDVQCSYRAPQGAEIIGKKKND